MRKQFYETLLSVLLNGGERMPLARSEVLPLKLVIYSFGHATSFDRKRIVPIFPRRYAAITNRCRQSRDVLCSKGDSGRQVGIYASLLVHCPSFSKTATCNLI